MRHTLLNKQTAPSPTSSHNNSPTLPLNEAGQGKGKQDSPDADAPDAIVVQLPRKRLRSIYLLPNLLTTGTLFAGFFAIISGMQGKFDLAGIAILAAMLFDLLDGRVARIIKAQSIFGMEYDSLSDMVAFGVAPALIVFSWGLATLGKPGWVISFIYSACTALRLARYNARSNTDSPFFFGLACPMAAGLMCFLIWVMTEEGMIGEQVPMQMVVGVSIATVLLSLLMVSSIRYYSFKNLFVAEGQVPFMFMLVLVGGVAIVAINPPYILLLMTILYTISGPLLELWLRIKRKNE